MTVATASDRPLRSSGALGSVAAIWGVLGVVALLGQALWRLTPIAIEPLLEGSLTTAQAVVYVVWVIFSAYVEGYRAFQRRFSPRVAARALFLAKEPTFARAALAPLFCMALFHATRRAKALAWGTVVMVIGFIIALRHVPQPWRGIVDGGVVVALAWGAVAIVVFYARGWSGKPLPVTGDLPSAS